MLRRRPRSPLSPDTTRSRSPAAPGSRGPRPGRNGRKADGLRQLRDLLVGLPQGGALREAVYLIGSMLAGGVLGYWVRVLYRRFATTLSNRDSFSSTFPLLTVATILVISVIKSSLDLSLGLVGGPSIVRFRGGDQE